MQDAIAFADVLSGRSDVVANGDLVADGDFCEGCAVGTALHLVGVFEGNTASAPSGTGAPVMMRDRFAPSNGDVGEFAGCDYTRYIENDGVVSGCSVGIGSLQRIAVHCGVVERRDVVGCECVLGEDLPDCFEEQCAL